MLDPAAGPRGRAAPVGSFGGGEYLEVFDVTGNITVRVTHTGGGGTTLETASSSPPRPRRPQLRRPRPPTHPYTDANPDSHAVTDVGELRGH